jgi:hypothetical protein
MEDYAQYSKQVNDLFFEAKSEVPDVNGFGDQMYYYQRRKVSVLGCAVQYQICNPTLPSDVGCSPLTGKSVLGEISFKDLRLNDRQGDISQRIWNITEFRDLWDYIIYLGSNALLAENYLSTGTGQDSAALPNDQWIQEVLGWHNSILATLQRSVLEYAQGPFDQRYNADKYIDRPEPEQEWMCQSQIIRGTSFYNFSIFGLTVLIGAGALIVILNQTLAAVVGLVQRFTHRGLSRQEEWRLTHSLQLQRMAFEGAGIGSWEGKDRAVPVTACAQMFSLPVDVPAYGAALPPYSSVPQQPPSSQPYDPLMKNYGIGTNFNTYTEGHYRY